MISFKRTAEPGTEPVSLTEVKAHLRLTAPGAEAAYTDEDTHLSTLIKAARRSAEKYTERSFITQTWKYYNDSFPNTIELLYGPVSSITSVEYIIDEVTTTLDTDEYVTDLAGKVARIEPVESWPSVDERINSVIVTYTAGFGAAAVVPEDIKAAILLMIGKMYQDREDSIKKMPTAAECLLDNHKVYHAL